MPDPVTPYGFTKPTVGMDRDTWGAILNTNWDLADGHITNLVASIQANSGAITAIRNAVINYVEPVGTVKMWPNPDPPPGWFACDGNEVSRTDYADLFAVIGGWWGAGNGSTTFNIPDLKGKVLVHRGDWIGFSQRFGDTHHQLSINEMPAHAHGGTTEWDGQHQHGYARPDPSLDYLAGGGSRPAGAVGDSNDPAGGHTHTFTTGNAGAGWSHNNVQPSVALLAIIKAVHVGF